MHVLTALAAIPNPVAKAVRGRPLRFAAALALSIPFMMDGAGFAASTAMAQTHESGGGHSAGGQGGGHGGGYGAGHLSSGHGGHRYGSGRSGAKHSGGTHIDHLHADSGAVGGADLEDNVFRHGGGYQTFALRGRDGTDGEMHDEGQDGGHDDGDDHSHE